MKARSGKRRWKILIGIFMLLTLALFLAIHFIAPYGIIQPPKMNENLNPSDLGLNFENIELEGEGQINLTGYLITPGAENPNAVMILIHGIGGCKEHFLPLSRDLVGLGIASIVVDVRAHGKSGGEFCTYGYHEKKDISKIVDFIQSRYPMVPIGIWGNSMGGAIAIQSLEHDERINFGIIESTFSSLEQIVIDYQTRLSKGIALPTISKYALKRAGQIADFDPNDVSPLNSVIEIEQPIFLAHGDKDKNISIDYGRQLFENLKSKDKTFYPVIGGGHFGLFEAGGEDYVKSILSFIEENIGANTQIVK